MQDLQKYISSISVQLSKEGQLADVENRLPYANLELLKKAGFLSLVIPTNYGGLGINFFEYQIIICQIAKHCASTAAILNMHCSILGGVAELAQQKLTMKQKEYFIPHIEKLFNLVIKDKVFIASANTEPGIGSRLSQIQTTYQHTDNGYILNGVKSFVTMSDYADYYLVLAKDISLSVNNDSMSNISYLFVNRRLNGITIESEWDTLGMRATQSNMVTFKNVILPSEALFLGTEGFALAKILLQPHWTICGYAGVYLGVMQAAFEFTIDFIKSRTNFDNGKGLAYHPLLQSRLGRMYMLFEQAKLVLTDAANAVCNEESIVTARRKIYHAKYIVGEYAMELTSLAIKSCGGSSLHKELPLERYFRDARCGALMPAVSDVCELYLGKDLLTLTTDDLW